MAPTILPPPLTILHVPPPGVPVNPLVLPSHIAAVLVVLDAVPGLSFTVKILSLVDPEQAPLAAMVYLTVTLVLAPTAGEV